MANVHLIGVRGIPNRYGGFERLVEVLAPHLAARGHEVTVYCEGEEGQPAATDTWHGVRRVFVPPRYAGARATLAYDWQSFAQVPAGAVALIFGYGTGLFQRRLTSRGIRHAVNMDGIEWQRQKWGAAARAWLRLNERAAARLADELIADHPEIQRYLQDSLGAASTMIAYGVDLDAPPEPVSHPLLDRHAGSSYFLVIARPEPENQIHVLLEAHERASDVPLVVVGNFDANEYGRQLMQRHRHATFAGPIYDKPVLDSLRQHSMLYLHGHSVGGTNPSLIEAMASGAVVVAHDNRFNRWVLANGGLYFRNACDLAALLAAPPDTAARARLKDASRRRCEANFAWPMILGQYESVVQRLAAT